MIKEITLCKKEDFENRFLNNTSFKNLFVDSTENLVANSWTYDYDNHIFKVNVGNNMASQIVIKENLFNIGDIITIESEVYCENEISSFIEYTLRDDTNSIVLQDSYKIYANDLNKWKKIQLSIVVTKKSNLQINIGASHSQVAKYIMKPIKIVFNKLEDADAKGIEVRRFAIKKENGSWIINTTFSSEELTFASSGKALLCTFNKNPFLGNRKPIANITMGEKGHLYFATLFGSYNNMFLLNLYKRADLTTSIDNLACEDGTEIFVVLYQ